jgi:hypothetical protein
MRVKRTNITAYDSSCVSAIRVWQGSNKDPAPSRQAAFICVFASTERCGIDVNPNCDPEDGNSVLNSVFVRNTLNNGVIYAISKTFVFAWLFDDPNSPFFPSGSGFVITVHDSRFTCEMPDSLPDDVGNQWKAILDIQRVNARVSPMYATDPLPTVTATFTPALQV